MENVKRTRLLESIQYSIDEGADVINASWGFEPSPDRAFAEEVSQKIKESGVLIVAAAGNNGDSYSTVSTPGVARNVLTVGAVGEGGGIAEFSSRGPTPYDRLVKPEVVAPGENIAAEVPTPDGDTKVEVRSGTSCATPMVTGCISYVLEAHPSWSPQQIKNAITSTSRPLLDNGELYDVYAQGAGLVSAKHAVETELIVEDAVLNFGAVYAQSPLVETIRLKNIGEDERRIHIWPIFRNVESNEYFSGRVDIEPSSTQLDPDDQQEVEVMINPPDAPGLYSGRLFLVSEQGDRHTAIFGYTKFPPSADRSL